MNKTLTSLIFISVFLGACSAKLANELEDDWIKLEREALLDSQKLTDEAYDEFTKSLTKKNKRVKTRKPLRQMPD